jgi:hypothetical protein
MLFSAGNGLLATNPANTGEPTMLFTATGNVVGATATQSKIAFASQPPFTQRLWSIAIDPNSGRVRDR